MNDKFHLCLAVSKAGHDKGMICVIIKEDKEFFYLADGRQRKVESPKKKKCKHVNVIIGKSGEPVRFDGELLTNRFLRKWIREQTDEIDTERRNYSG